MTHGSRSRGEPLAAFAVLLVAWIAVRAIFWEPPFLAAARSIDGARLVAVEAVTSAKAMPAGDIDPHSRPVPKPAIRSDRILQMPSAAMHWRGAPAARYMPRLALANGIAPTAAPEDTEGWLTVVLDRPLSTFAPQQHSMQTGSVAPGLHASAGVASRRWSGDSWVLYRSGGGFSAAGALPSYGGSQAGAVLRFAISPSSALRPQAYVRASAALGSNSDREAALGLSARPLANVPVRLLGEARVRLDGPRQDIRPAVLAVSEVPPIRLPLAAEAEVYLQAGYVGGKGSTPFVDAQAMVDRAVVGSETSGVRLGAGAWAGGQEGAQRLDVGPHVSLRIPSPAGAARLAFDWRFRIAGNARPRSGPAFTFSAGF